jgi:hypothetical protein
VAASPTSGPEADLNCSEKTALFPARSS